MLLTMPMALKAQQYHVAAVAGERVLIDSSYVADAAAEEFLQPYRHLVDSVMSPVVGRTARALPTHKPESELSNLMCDIIVWKAEQYGEHPDLGLYNFGGIRASLPAGDITLGEINDIAPFSNYISLVTLTGEQLTELFQQVQQKFGTAVSHGVEVRYNDRQLTSVTLNGKPLDPARQYRIVTINYLLQGNDAFTNLSRGTDTRIYECEDGLMRNVIAEYFRMKSAKGEEVDSHIEGRTIVTK